MVFVQILEALETQEPPQLITGALERAGEESLQHAGSQPDVDLTVFLGKDSHLQQLNLQYRGVDAPTDVLSFFSGEVDPETDRLYLGDVIISYPRAAAQAYGHHPVLDELRLLTVHGVLHLLGYDHGSPEEKEAMWAVQADILNSLGSPISPP